MTSYDLWKTSQREWPCPACETVWTNCTGPDADDPQGEFPDGVCEQCEKERMESEDE